MRKTKQAHQCVDDRAGIYTSKTTGGAKRIRYGPFIRNLVQGIRICEKPPEQYVDMLRELSAIGNNVNQIAHWANSKGDASQAEIHEVAVRVNEAYMMVRDAFR